MENKITLKEIFDNLRNVSIKEYVKEKDRLKYLSWSRCEHILNVHYPNNEIQINYFDGKPFLYDAVLGYMVSITVTIEGHAKTMTLPVMNGSNKALKSEKQSYFVANWVKGADGKNVKNGEIEKFIEPATMFDINNALMRCRVKCIALFGLGLDLYEGEDMPKVKTAESEKPFLVVGTSSYNKVTEYIVKEKGNKTEKEIFDGIRSRYLLEDAVLVNLLKLLI